MPISFTSIAFVIALLSSLSITKAQLADPTNIGCTNYFGLPEGITVQAGNVAACTAECTYNEALYSFFSVERNTCYCSIDGPVQPATYYEQADSSTGGCLADNTEGYTVSALTPPGDFGFQTCYNPTTLTGTANRYGDIRAAMNDCYQNYITFVFSGNTGNYYCDNTGPTGSSLATCDSTSAYTLRKVMAQPSGDARRRRLSERLEAVKRLQEEEFCPRGLNACQVPDQDAYECIDIQSELESCGGCTNGLYSSAIGDLSLGTDCTALPGVHRGAVTCSSGVCVAYACQDGYTLAGGICSVM